MLKIWIGIIATLTALAACAPMNTAQQSAPTVEGTAGKAVVYLVRTRPDTSYLTAPLYLDDQVLGSTFAGTYRRIELTPGRHRISGAGADTGAITLDVQADHVYFVQHSVSGSWRATSPHSFFTLLDEGRGRAAMSRTSKEG